MDRTERLLAALNWGETKWGAAALLTAETATPDLKEGEMISGKPERAIKQLSVLHVSLEGFNAIKMAAREMKRRGSDIQRQALTEWFAKHVPSYAPKTFNPPKKARKPRK